MKFDLIDLEKWDRKELFDYFYNEAPCSFSITCNLDITLLIKAIKEKDFKFYGVMIYLIACLVNKHKEFRTAMDKEGNIGIYDRLHPQYTYLAAGREQFINIYSAYTTDFKKFHETYLADIEKYGSSKKFYANDIPENHFLISNVPWISFTAHNLNIPKASSYLLPIFTFGKYFEQNDKILLPFTIQAHHGVCDGFHVARFFNELQEKMNHFDKEMFA